MDRNPTLPTPAPAPTPPPATPSPHPPLTAAVIVGDLALAQRRLAEGADPQAAGPLGECALQLAAGLGRADLAAALLGAGAHPGGLGPGQGQSTPLGLACLVGSAAVIELLAAHGVDVNAPIALPGGSLTRPLHLAAAAGHVEAVDALLGLGADPAGLDELGEDAAQAAWGAGPAGGERALGAVVDRIRAAQAQAQRRAIEGALGDAG